MNENEMRTSNILEIPCRIEKSPLTIKMEVVVKNRSFPRPLSINHADSSET